jgi:FkbM family methyltransferase
MKGRIKKVRGYFGTFSCVDGDLITKNLEAFGAHSLEELNAIFSFIKEGDIVLDIGAHIGTFSIPIAQKVGSKGHIHSFEAFNQNYDLLNENIKNNKLTNRISTYFGVVTDQSRCYRPFFDQNNSGGTYFIQESSDETTQTNSIVPDQIIDQDGPPISFIKIDVEGMEIDVLHACKKIIEKYKPILYMEINRHALKRQNTTPNLLEKEMKAWGYHYFKHLIRKENQKKTLELKRLRNLKAGGRFFDLLAIHPDNEKYPSLPTFRSKFL